MTAFQSATGSWAYGANVSLLSNGMQVLVEEDQRFPLVSLRLYVHAGAAYEQPEKAGISHLLEHMVFKGTEKRAPGEVALDVEKVGGYINAATGFDHTVYKIDLPAAEWKLGLDVLQDMTFGASIDPRELEREKKVVLSEIDRIEDNPQRKLFQSIQPMLWGGTPYEHPVIGYPETVTSITREDIFEYIERLYQPQKMLLVVCGNVKEDEVLKEADSLFGSLRNTRQTLPVHPDEIRSGRIDQPEVTISSGPWNKAYLSLAFPIPGFRSEMAPSLEVLTQIMGGDQTSRLYRKYKYELQLVDEISVSSLMLERGGVLYIQVQLDPDKVEIFWEKLLEDLFLTDDPEINDVELSRAKINLEDSLFQAMETLGGLASKLGYFQFFENSLRAEDKYIYDLRTLTADQVGAAYQKTIRESDLRVGLLIPEEVRIDKEAFTSRLEDYASAQKKKTTQSLDEAEAQGVEILTFGENTLVMIPDNTLPYTALTMAWTGGDSLLKPDEQGLASMTARALTRGISSMNATAIQDFLSDRAADVDASAGRETFSMHAKFLTRHSDDVLPLIRDMILAPSFEPQEVRRSANEQIAEIVEREDRPLGLLFRNVFPFLFGDHPYGYHHLGQSREIIQFGRDEVVSYWERQKEQPWVMTVCGQLDREAVDDLAQKLSSIGKGERLSLSEPAWTDHDELTLALPERAQAHLLVVFEVPGLDGETTPGITLLKTLLAGQGGILFQELRDEQGLGYSVTAMAWQTRVTGFIAFYIGTTPEQVDQARDGFQRIVQRIQREPLSESEVARAKNLMEGDYYRDHQSLLSRSSEAASLLVKELDIGFNRKVIERAKHLTPKDLQRIAQDHLDWDRAYLMKVMP